MLFDLRSGKRRRVVQVVYSLLAVSFLIGFVFFGVGTGGIGSVSDLFGGGSGGSVTAQFDDQIDSANAQLEKNPKNTAALLKLAENEYFKAKTGISQDPTTGQVSSISGDAHTELGRSADAWAKYLKLEKRSPDAGVAAEMVQVYILLNDGSGAVQAQRIVAEETPTQNSYGTLALILYGTGDISGGDKAAKKAESLAPKGQRKQLAAQLDQFRKQGIKVKKQQAKAQKNAQKNAPSTTAPGASPLQSPFGGAGPTP
jgi:hypothetical protein